MYVMGEKVGHSVLPVKRPGSSSNPRVLGSWNKGRVKPIDAPLVSTGTKNTHEVHVNCITIYSLNILPRGIKSLVTLVK